MSAALKQHALDILDLTGGPPVASSASSEFDPPIDIMGNYSCEQIRTYGAGGYGFGTMHKIPGGFATALHVTRIEDKDLVLTIADLEKKYGPHVRFEQTDLHLFGVEDKPSVPADFKLEPGLKLSIVGCPAGSSFPEIHHVEYYFANSEIQGHWVQSVQMEGLSGPKAIVGGNSGGGVYLGHLSYSDLKNAQSIGHVRAQGDIRKSETDYDHFAIVSFWND